MGLQSSLPDGGRVLVADTSTIINLNATGCAEEILRALPHRLAAVEAVRDELEDGRPKGRSDAARFEALVGDGLIDVVSLGADGWIHFEGLVVGAASETLDDGEAATIAFAAEVGAVALIDERKALRLAVTRFPAVHTASTVDVLFHPAVIGTLGISAVASAVFHALKGARMRVQANHVEAIIQLIGSDRAGECTSLPRAARAGRSAGVAHSG